MLALKMHEHSQPAALCVGHRSTRLTSTYQFRAAQLLRLAEEKGSKTLGNTWYVKVFLRFIHYPRGPLNKSGESHEARDPVQKSWSRMQPRDLGQLSTTSITRQPFASSRSVVTEHFRSTIVLFLLFTSFP